MAYLRVLILSFIISCAMTIESSFYLEPPCAAKNGFCVLENECPHPVTSDFKNLCIAQKRHGAICCKDFPQDQLDCRQSAHECMDWCAEDLRRERKGCPSNEMCCVLA